MHGHFRHGEYHRDPRWQRRRMGPLGRYVRARLRRRLFAWMAGSILFTALAVGGGMVMMSRFDDNGWHADYERGRHWVGNQFARVWDDPVAREQFAVETSRDLNVGFTLTDAQGARLSQTGPDCKQGFDVPVKRDGTHLGDVHICMNRSAGPPGRGIFALVLLIAMLWAGTGRIARRIARPLDELTAVVKRIGAGDLKARTERAPFQPDEIGVVAEAVNDMAARIEKQVQDQRELLAAVSHELRTPLARLRLVSEIARDTGPTAKTWDQLDREILDMDALVGELLASSRVDFGGWTPREFDVRETAVNALERLNLSPELLQFDRTDAKVTADPTLLLRALSNLLDNARKHAGSVERLVVRDAENGVAFEVLDRGPGIPAGDEARVFEPFQRSGEKKVDGLRGQTHESGLGLGLSLVKRIAEAHGGTAWAKAREGGGAIVGFSISNRARPA